MSQTKFQEMSQKELLDYTLSHRDDQEAFYAYSNSWSYEVQWKANRQIIELTGFL